MIALTLNAIRIIVYTASIVPVLALAVVADPNQSVRPPIRFSAAAAIGSATQEEMVSRLIVKPRHLVGGQLNADLLARDARRLSHAANVSMSVVR